MPTGLALANFQNKSLVGYQDLGERMLAYLKASHEDATQARFDLDGAVAALIPGTPTVADTHEFGTGKATDGIGHIFDLTQLSVAERTVVSPNQVGITYYWAAAYAQEASGIRVSPRTGAPQYVQLIDTIGEEGPPNSVVDNGNGTITLNINSVTEAGVDHSGKDVTVWLVIPESASEAVAIETIPAVFGGGNNTITTVGGLGQASISTNPADYVVLARGVSYRTNPFPNGFFNLGTTLGNGPAAVPNALDTSTQRLLKTFQDASQIAFAPYKWIASVDIQAAAQELIDDLEEHTTATAGAIRIGVNPQDFADKVTEANHQLLSAVGGVGTIGDGTFAAAVDRQVSRALAEIDRTLRSRYTQFTYGLQQDSDDTTLAPSFGERMYHLRPQDISPGYNVGSMSANAKVVGEQGDDLRGTPQRLDFNGPVDPVSDPTGEYERCLLTTHDGALGQEMLSARHLFLRKCGVELGGVHFGADGAESFRHVQDCDFHEPAGLNPHVGDYGVRFSNNGFSNSATMLVFERSIFRGSTSATRTFGDLHFGNLGDQDSERRPMVFRDCTFLQGRDDLPILTNDSAMSVPVMFENCVFISTDDHTVALVVGTAPAWQFRNCFFLAKNGNAIHIARGANSGLDDCFIKTGDQSAPNPISDPLVLAFSGSNATQGQRAYIRNLTVEIGRSVPTGQGGPADMNPLIRIGSPDDGSAGHGPIDVDGLYVHYTALAASAKGSHQSATILFDFFNTTGLVPGVLAPSIRNVVLDLNGARMLSQDASAFGADGMLSIWGLPGANPIVASNIQIVRAQQNSDYFGSRYWIVIEEGVHLLGGSAGPFNEAAPGLNFVGGNIRVGNRCNLANFSINMGCPQGQKGPAIRQTGETSRVSNCEVRYTNTQIDTIESPLFIWHESGAHSTIGCEFVLDWTDLATGMILSGVCGEFSHNKVAQLQNTGGFRPIALSGEGYRVLSNHVMSSPAGTWIDVNGDNNLIADNVTQGGVSVSDSGSGNVFRDNISVNSALWP